MQPPGDVIRGGAIGLRVPRVVLVGILCVGRGVGDSEPEELGCDGCEAGSGVASAVVERNSDIEQRDGAVGVI